MVYPILKNKIEDLLWFKHCIQGHTFDNFIKPHLYSPKTELDSVIYNIHSTLFDSSMTCLNIDELSVGEYILQLESIKNNELTIEESAKIDHVVSHLNRLSQCYIVGSSFRPQIVMNEIQGRVYFHPMFNWKEKWVDALFSRFKFLRVDQGKMLVKFDFNGAVPRSMILYLFFKTKIDQFLKLATSCGDIYSHMSKLLNIQNFGKTRDDLKIDFLSYLFGGERPYLKASGSELIKYFDTYILPLGKEFINKYSVLTILKILNKISDFVDKEMCVPFLNYDGGYFICLEKDISIICQEFPFIKFNRLS